MHTVQKGLNTKSAEFQLDVLGMSQSIAKNPAYRVAENGEWIRITDSGEQRTGFYYVRGGRAAP
jgi:hypothetical protein